MTRKTVGFRLHGRGIARHGYPVWHEGKQVDLVRSGGQSPSLGYAIGTTMLPGAGEGGDAVRGRVPRGAARGGGREAAVLDPGIGAQSGLTQLVTGNRGAHRGPHHLRRRRAR